MELIGQGAKKMKEALWVDCRNGVSGDMMVGALLSLGADFEFLEAGLTQLNLTGFHIEQCIVEKNNELGTSFEVVLADTASVGDMTLTQILGVLEASSLSIYAKELASRIFQIAAEAGAAAHRTDLEGFYFHEKGALDSFADIVGLALCLENLGQPEVFFCQLTDGSGFITIRSGRRIPVPVPAVRKIVERYQLELIETPIEGELVTPTGAAIVVGSRSENPVPQEYQIIKTGIGIGTRAYNPDASLRIHRISY